MTGLRILDPGPLALVRGPRPARATPPSASDAPARSTAARCGSATACSATTRRSAGIEVLLGGFDARFERDGWFAVTGAVGPLAARRTARWMRTSRSVRASGQRAADRRCRRRRAPVPGGPRRGRRRARARVALARHRSPASDPRRCAPATCSRSASIPAPTVPLLDFVPGRRPRRRASSRSAPTAGRAPTGSRPRRSTRSSTVEWRCRGGANRIGPRLDPVRGPAHRGAHARAATPPRCSSGRSPRELPSEPMVAGRRAGLARRPADGAARRPSGDRRLPGDRRGRRRLPRRLRAAPPRPAGAFRHA